MKVCKIPKGNGKTRTIYVPSAKEKTVLRRLVGKLTSLAEKACPVSVPHGFMRGRSAVTNAQSHVGHRFTLTMDLKDFFDSVTEFKLKGKVPDEMLTVIMADGAARQGLPTSPAASNIAAGPLDKAILKWIAGTKPIVYTRYADDLSFSFDDEELLDVIVGKVREIATRCGFCVAEQKTHLYDSRDGRRIICGVAVDDALHPTREVKRKLRAARHQDNKQAVRGLEEWMKLKPPALRNSNAAVGLGQVEEVMKLAKLWRLGHVRAKEMPDKGPDEVIGDDVVVTGDPVYMLGMSTWTTGWTSCHSHPSGSHRRGCVFWSHLRGTKVAAVLSKKTAVIAGVERRVMVARCLVHELRNGTKVYDRVYGDKIVGEKLVGALRATGYISPAEAKLLPGDKKVMGHAPVTWKAWFDSLASSVSTATVGQWCGKKVRVCHL